MNFQRIFRVYRSTIIILGIGACITFIAYWMMDQIFRLRTVEVMSREVRIEVDMNRLSGNLLFLPTDTLRKETLVRYPMLQDIRFERIFPYTLRIIPIVRTPCASLKNSTRTVIVDCEGMILYADAYTLSSLPLVDIPLDDQPEGTMYADPGLHLSLRLIADVHDIEIAKIRQVDRNSLEVQGTYTILVSTEKSYEETFRTLQRIIEGFRMKGSVPRWIDIRYDKPVIQ